MFYLKIIFSVFLFSQGAFAGLKGNYIATADRNSSSISLIDVASNYVVKTITKDDVGFEFEPMYVSHIASQHLFAVGDRKNDKLLVFDDSTADYIGSIDLTPGVFHQWSHPVGRTIVLATDKEVGADLVKLRRGPNGKLYFKKRRFDLPAQFANTGKPHDVVVDGRNFYLSFHDKNNQGEEIDRVIKVDLNTLEVKKVLKFSKDVHLGMPAQSPYLLVLEQSGKINLVNRTTMEVTKTISNLPGAHGVFTNPDGSRVFAANIGSAGPNSLYELARHPSVGIQSQATASSNFSKPHNISVDFSSQQLFLTHSGPNKTVSVFDISGPVPVLKNQVVVGDNPFGLGLIRK